MSVQKERKTEIVDKFGVNTADTGRPEVQIALLTERITDLQRHFKENPKDFHSRRGLLKLVGKRKRMLEYLKNEDIEKYRSLIQDLGLRR
ncbi:MAG TPA: 30S ribosomal protein S15 [bacterium]|jgi:small subunit ribosomal protein S15|nr:30S ribosomal protein S15 [bacterium]HNT66137.1 30S ribosomal protein S15 [bacterium]HOX87065.1 30S ribosomal protein S15 [bacterium]HPG46396.1 30S ribosomal protein S15 [bacterium]HPM98690.1 30S ribosomal protein S15 [bacterium]